jgi:hemerythrin-like domain-containing protein
MIARLRPWTERLKDDADPRDLSGFVRFFQGFVEGWHHAKEEGLLFPAMVEAGFPRDSGPVAVMEAEHLEGRRLTHRLAEYAVRPAEWTPDDRGRVATLARAYLQCLRAHLQKEEAVLFPMVQARLPESVFAGIGERMAAMMRASDEHEHLHGLGESLARRMGVPVYRACCAGYPCCPRGQMGGLD